MKFSKVNYRTMRKFLIYTFMFSLSILTACNSRQTISSNGAIYGPERRFSVKLPKDWVIYTQDKKAITVTRDGMGLQFIRVGFWPFANIYQAINKKARADMLPSELAELIIAMTRADEYTKNAKIIENKPYLMQARQGFRIKFRFRNEKGLRYQRDVYGIAGNDGVYFIIYQATVLHYYKATKREFDALLKSFKVNK